MSKWLENAVFYEIYPQSFNDSNSDGIGDIHGIAEKLEYIKELGCNAVWLNPCFASPFADAGYDVSDYYRVAPRYGTNDDLKALFEKAHKMDMRIILDLVPGHTSIEHPWFVESMKAEKNEYTHRYIWTDSIWKSPAGLGSISGAIRGISDRDGSCAVNFFSSQPALNYGFADPTESWMLPADSPEAAATAEEMKDIMRFWLDMGCDGFRVDMAFSLVKNDENRAATIRLWQSFRRFLDEEYPDAVIISEWGDPAQSLEGGFHADFLLHFGESHYLDLFRTERPYFAGNGDISEFVRRYEEYRRAAGENGIICPISGNHDMERLAWKLSPEEIKLAFAFLLSFPGTPFIYYGDEIGMRYLDGIKSVEGGFNRTGSRSPMQWDDGRNAGFSDADAGDLYIPIDPDENRPCVSKQINDSHSVYSEVKRLIRLRKENKALDCTADIEFIKYGKNAYPLIYRRFTEGESIYVIINPSAADETVSYTFEGTVLYAIGSAAYKQDGQTHVPAHSATFIKR